MRRRARRRNPHSSRRRHPRPHRTRRNTRRGARQQEGYIASEWGASDNNRKARYYKLTRAGRKRLAQETQKWETTTAILARFFAPPQES